MSDLFTVTRHGALVTDEDLVQIARSENWAKGLLFCDISGWSVDQDGSLMLSDDCGVFRYAPDEFQIVWNVELMRRFLP